MRVGKLGWFLLVSLVAAFWPVWRWYVARIADGSDESYGVVALLIAAVYGWKYRSEIRFTHRQTVVAVALVTLYALTFPVMPPLLRAGFVIGVLVALLGPVFRKPGIVGLMFLSLPVVASLQFYAGYPLRVLAAGFSTTVLGWMQYDVVRSGTDLIYRGSMIGVDAPCSGIQTLYTSMMVVFAMAAFSQLNWRRTTLLCGAGVAAAVLGNALRVTVLFFKESGIWKLPEWTHQGIGVLIFGFVVGVILFLGSKLTSKLEDTAASVTYRESRPMNRKLVVVMGIVALLAGMLPLAGGIGASGGDETSAAVWPKQWEGEWLEPMPLTRRESAFAEGFPGKIGVFQAGENRVILRTVNRATRKLHSSADCLKASGYEVNHERPGDFKAVRGAETFAVTERIYESEVGNAREWADVSGWFWDAALNRSEGPWVAITVISPDRSHDQTLSVR